MQTAKQQLDLADVGVDAQETGVVRDDAQVHRDCLPFKHSVKRFWIHERT